MKKLISLIVLISIMMSSISACAVVKKEKIILASDGKSDYVVVKSTSATASENTAVEEFCSYFKKICGASLEIITDDNSKREKEICIGSTNRATDINFNELGDDGFYIKTDGSSVIIAGSGVRGALYGVYSFLEEYMGCRFYTPDVEKVPENKDLSIYKITENKQIPVFKYRCPYWTCSFDENWSVKQKCNGAPGRSVSTKNGGCVRYAGKETEEYQVHTLWRLAEMGNTHTGAQPCMTDPEVYNTVLKNVRAVLREYPDSYIISVSQNDGPAELRCQCEECMALEQSEESPMGPYLKFVNAIADDIKEEFPNVIVSTLAYYFTIKPPKTITPHENVSIQLCPVECCRAHSITECNTGSMPELTTDFYKYLQQWASVCDKIWIWDYTTDFMYYQTPFPNFLSMQKDAAAYAQNNVTGMFSQGLFQYDTSVSSGEFSELRAYLIAKLMWDPEMTQEEYYAHMDDFLTGYYGDGGQFIREYIDLAEIESHKIGTNERPVDGLRHWDIYDAVLQDSKMDIMEIFPVNLITVASKTRVPDPAFINNSKDLFDKAEKLCENEYELSRVQCARIQIKFYESVFLESEYEYMVESYKRIYPSSSTPADIRNQKFAELKETYDQKLTKLNKSLYSDFVRFGITRMSETRFLAKENEIDWTLPCTSWMK